MGWFGQAGRVARQPRYPSDLTDEEWALIEPLLPPAGTGGRPEEHPRRDVVDAVPYVVRTGCAWRNCLPIPALADGVLLFRALGEAAGHAADARHPAAAGPPDRRTRCRAVGGHHRLPERQGPDPVSRTTRGYDAGKKINGRKRFVITDTLGLLLTVTMCAASVQDRDGAKGALLGLYLTMPRCRFVFADAGFAGRLVLWHATCSTSPSASSANPQIRRDSPSCPAAGR